LRNGDQGVIENIHPRRSLLFRSNQFKQKLIAANVTQIIVVLATEPTFSDELITRCLVAAECQDLKVLIVLNKCDLSENVPESLIKLATFEGLGYPVLRLAARKNIDALRPYLFNETSVLVGQSGMGKSTLTNALIPEADAPTREISEALDSGKHTTTHATLYHLDEKSTLIDSPGLQEFGLHHLSTGAIEYGFRELRALLGQCRFRDCCHDQEPDCAVRGAVKSGAIDQRRYAVLRSLLGEVSPRR
jgi:ribosome biogenesis GTPase